MDIWSGSVNLAVMPITGNPMFDWFFSVVIYFGLMSTVLGWLFRIISRS